MNSFENKEKFKEQAQKILSNYSIENIKGEEKTIKFLYDIVEDKIPLDEYSQSSLDNIDMYLSTKENMQIALKDLKFLNNLANSLKIQKIRKTDNNEFLMYQFKVIDIYKNEHFFLTRDAALEYIQNFSNIFSVPNIIEIKVENNTQLASLLDIIKRNYSN